MSFRSEAVEHPGGRRSHRATGVVDYRLARRQVITQFRKGRLSRLDVCDAHPELRRAATGVGEHTAESCPICERGPLTLVTYAFGPRLSPGGRCIASVRELANLRRGSASIACYVVEVCLDCAWNHLRRVFHVGGGAS